MVRTYMYIDAICVHDENGQHMPYTSHPVLTDLPDCFPLKHDLYIADCFPLQEGVCAAHSAVRNGHLAVLKFLIEECNCGTEEKTHVRLPMHVCLLIPCLCVHACVHVKVCILCVYYV